MIWIFLNNFDSLELPTIRTQEFQSLNMSKRSQQVEGQGVRFSLHVWEGGWGCGQRLLLNSAFWTSFICAPGEENKRSSLSHPNRPSFRFRTLSPALRYNHNTRPVVLSMIIFYAYFTSEQVMTVQCCHWWQLKLPYLRIWVIFRTNKQQQL